MKIWIVFIIIACIWAWGVNYFSSGFSWDKKIQYFISIPDTSSDKAKEFVVAAKRQIGVTKTYDFTNGYYGDWWFPPENTWVCTDVIWRAYRNFWMNFKSEIIAHQRLNPDLYENFGDSNISFRRVKNMNIFFKKTTKVLTNNLIPWNEENLLEWQQGDIVIFDALPPKNLWHIWIISDKRNAQWVPYMIDNHWMWTSIRITPLDWKTPIIWHYRSFP